MSSIEETMSDGAQAPAAAKPGRKRSAMRSRKGGPTLTDMIVTVVSASKERSGMSLPALKKALAARGYDVNKNRSRVRVTVKSMLSKGTLIRTRGKGASGSFRIGRRPSLRRRRTPGRRRRRRRTRSRRRRRRRSSRRRSSRRRRRRRRRKSPKKRSTRRRRRRRRSRRSRKASRRRSRRRRSPRKRRRTRRRRRRTRRSRSRSRK